MDNLEVADDYQQVQDQLAILNARGEDVTEDQLIKRTLKRGLEEILDYRMDGTYYRVAWDEAGNLSLTDVYGNKAGVITPIKNSLIEDFKADDQGVWDHFNLAIMKSIAR
ncbi:hypothetical protein LQZ24_03635 [Fructobacillus sp. M1-13]|uniref:Uncharacterized protein n=1 Tax=Fructobacillus papyriferae TaxID=2713171 RepID=A0ABS5QPW1_9LACO|nr:hypothetical protein [Fructobacillus papyriferae]MBS9335213.1 hypothetical protein [Fructobacillus papyriferae]MCD2159118.1 hypothetical protein [Fructobacillus papyriferae]